jgi:hypothetical protein
LKSEIFFRNVSSPARAFQSALAGLRLKITCVYQLPIRFLLLYFYKSGYSVGYGFMLINNIRIQWLKSSACKNAVWAWKP